LPVLLDQILTGKGDTNSVVRKLNRSLFYRIIANSKPKSNLRSEGLWKRCWIPEHGPDDICGTGEEMEQAVPEVKTAFALSHNVLTILPPGLLSPAVSAA